MLSVFEVFQKRISVAPLPFFLYSASSFLFLFLSTSFYGVFLRARRFSCFSSSALIAFSASTRSLRSFGDQTKSIGCKNKQTKRLEKTNSTRRRVANMSTVGTEACQRVITRVYTYPPNAITALWRNTQVGGWGRFSPGRRPAIKRRPCGRLRRPRRIVPADASLGSCRSSYRGPADGTCSKE